MRVVTKITLEGIQIKSLEKAQKLSHALSMIEEECGIAEVKIEIKNSFVCPWIDLEDLKNTEMEKLVQGIFKKIKNSLKI